MGFTTGCQALGAVAGTVGAGLLVKWGGWEMIFLGRVPFILLALVLGVWWMSRDPRSQRGSSFDIPGAVTLGVALLCLVVGLRLGRSVGWLSPVVLALLVLAPVLLTLFWRIEGRAPWPVLPRGLLRVPGFVIPSAASFTAQLGVFVIWFIFPFYIGDVIGRDAVSMGTLFAVMAVLQMASSSGGGWLCDRVGPIWVGTTGVTVITLGMVYLGFLTANLDSPGDRTGNSDNWSGDGIVSSRRLHLHDEQCCNRTAEHGGVGAISLPVLRNSTVRRGYGRGVRTVSELLPVWLWG